MAPKENDENILLNDVDTTELDFLSSDVQALFTNDFELENINTPFDLGGIVGTTSTAVSDNAVINANNSNQVRNHYNYCPTGNNFVMSAFPQNFMPNVSNNNCNVNFHFYLK